MITVIIMKKQKCFKTWVGIFPGKFSWGGVGGGSLMGGYFPGGSFPEEIFLIPSGIYNLVNQFFNYRHVTV